MAKEPELAIDLDELFYWHDQCMTRGNVSGFASDSFQSAWRELNIRVERCAALTRAGAKQ